MFAHKFDICTYVFAAAAQILRIRRVHQKNITHTPCGRVLIVCMGVAGKIIAVRVHKKNALDFKWHLKERNRPRVENDLLIILSIKYLFSLFKYLLN